MYLCVLECGVVVWCTGIHVYVHMCTCAVFVVKVFDGREGAPYSCDASPKAINAYGRSKQAFEEALTETQHNYVCTYVCVYACI